MKTLSRKWEIYNLIKCNCVCNSIRVKFKNKYRNPLWLNVFETWKYNIYFHEQGFLEKANSYAWPTENVIRTYCMCRLFSSLILQIYHCLLWFILQGQMISIFPLHRSKHTSFHRLCTDIFVVFWFHLYILCKDYNGVSIKKGYEITAVSKIYRKVVLKLHRLTMNGWC